MATAAPRSTPLKIKAPIRHEPHSHFFPQQTNVSAETNNYSSLVSVP